MLSYCKISYTIYRIIQRPGDSIVEIFQRKLEDFMLVVEKMADHFKLKFPFPPHLFEQRPFIGCVRMIAAMVKNFI